MAYSYVWNIKQQWLQQQNNTWERGQRGLFLGGQTPVASNIIDYINISSFGNAADFGDLATAGYGTVASNSIRAVRCISTNNSIEYVTMSTLGNAADFGDQTDSYGVDSSVANDTRALYVGGYSAPTFSPGWNIQRIEYVTIPTLGNAANFGNLTQGRANQTSGANTTRGIFAGGYNGSPGFTNVADYVTIASAGNATDFGDLVGTTWAALPANSDIRLFCAGGQPSSNVISYFTFSTLGNSVDWGDLSVKGSQGSGSSNNVRGIFGMGEAAAPLGVASNVLEYVSLVTAGNSADFGDLTVGRQDNYGIAAQGHGGISIGQPRIGDTVLGTQVYFSGDRGIFAGFHNPAVSNVIDVIAISSAANSSDFGDLSVPRGRAGAVTSTTRFLAGGGETPSATNVIDSIQMSTLGNAADFGDLTVVKNQNAGLSNSTRGVFGGGYDGSSFNNVMDFVTIASIGNATDFGDLLTTGGSIGSCSSPTRGLFMGGRNPTQTNVIQYITIASVGNATDFGDLTAIVSTNAGSSSSTRAVSAGGLDPSDAAGVNTINFVTIASTGNATDFGDLTVSRYIVGGGTSNNLRAVFGGGRISPDNSNVMDFITIASAGNANDFGDLIAISAGRAEGSTSNGHGGLQ